MYVFKALDEYFLMKIKKKLEEKSPNDQDIINDLMARNLWKRVFEIHPTKGLMRKEGT